MFRSYFCFLLFLNIIISYKIHTKKYIPKFLHVHTQACKNKHEQRVRGRHVLPRTPGHKISNFSTLFREFKDIFAGKNVYVGLSHVKIETTKALETVYFMIPVIVFLGDFIISELGNSYLAVNFHSIRTISPWHT